MEITENKCNERRFWIQPVDGQPVNRQSYLTDATCQRDGDCQYCSAIQCTVAHLHPPHCGSPGGACAAVSCSWCGWLARERVRRRTESPTRHRAALPPGKNDGTDTLTSGEIEMQRSIISEVEFNHQARVVEWTDVSTAGYAFDMNHKMLPRNTLLRLDLS